MQEIFLTIGGMERSEDVWWRKACKKENIEESADGKSASSGL